MSERWEEGGPVGPADVGAVLADLRAARDRPPPTDPSSAGCTLAIVSIVTIVLMPFVGRFFDLTGGTMAAIGGALLLAAVLGSLLGFLGGGLARGAAVRDVAAALDELTGAYARGDAERSRRAAVRLLDAAFVAYDPTTGHTFDVAEAAERLGDALPLVERIERVLCEADEIRPLFTDPSLGGRP